MKGLTSEKLVEALKKFEGLRLNAYQDAVGVWTIGYGHTFQVKKGDRITEWYANDLLEEDIIVREKVILGWNICRTQGQLDALVSLGFNIGLDRLKKSTLIKCIQRGETSDVIKKEWLRWKYAGGKIMPGLLKRREWEVHRYFEDSEYLPFFNNK